MNTVYIICGESGVYDDYVSWEVEAYSTLELANARVEELHNLISDTQIQVRRDYPNLPEGGKLCELISAHPRGDKTSVGANTMITRLMCITSLKYLLLSEDAIK